MFEILIPPHFIRLTDVQIANRQLKFQIQCIEFTVDGSYLISVGNFKENALVLWDMSNYAVHTVAKVRLST